jgi:membrane-bound lytic murein transglycosylase F
MQSVTVRRSSYPTFVPPIACFLLVCGYVSIIHARSLAEIEQTLEIRFCVSPFIPQDTVEPADCRENCRFGGYSYDMTMAFLETLGKDIQPKFLRVEWDEQFFNKEGKVVRDDTYTPELMASGKSISILA